MLRFRGFKASLNFNSGKKNGVEQYDIAPGISLNGAYRINKDEQFDSDRYSEWPKKVPPSSMAKLPTRQSVTSSNKSKSTSNLTKPTNETIDTRKSAPDISQATTQPTKINIKEQKKLEKQRLTNQIKQEKSAEKERQRQQKLAEKERKQQEKLRKEREKQQIAQQTRAARNRPKNEEQNKTKKRTAPQPQQQVTTTQPQQRKSSTQPLEQRTITQPQLQRTATQPQQQLTASQPQQQQMPPTGTQSKLMEERQQYATNTLESSISKSSGPPPYSSVPEVTSKRNDTGNINLAKPVEDNDSWNLISQHRQQMNRQAGVSKSVQKQTRLDLHYNVGTSAMSKENSDA